MKTKISIDLPTAEKLLAGLDVHSVQPALVRSEAAVTEAARALEQRRTELADAERVVVASPARVQRGEVSADKLRELLRERDAAAMLIGPAEAELAKRNAAVEREQKLAQEALLREFVRRGQPLEAVVAEIGVALLEIRALAHALDKARGDGAVLALSWPDSPMSICEKGMHAWAQHAESEAARRTAASAAQVVSTEQVKP